MADLLGGANDEQFPTFEAHHGIGRLEFRVYVPGVQVPFSCQLNGRSSVGAKINIDARALINVSVTPERHIGNEAAKQLVSLLDAKVLNETRQGVPICVNVAAHRRTISHFPNFGLNCGALYSGKPSRSARQHVTSLDAGDHHWGGAGIHNVIKDPYRRCNDCRTFVFNRKPLLSAFSNEGFLRGIDVVQMFEIEAPGEFKRAHCDSALIALSM